MNKMQRGRRLAVAWTAAALATPALALEVGERAPEPSAMLDGRPLSLKALKGKVVLVDFWASWCGPCRQSFPWMNELHAKYAGQGLVVLGINVDRRREDADRFLAQVPARFQLAFDPPGQTPAAYGVEAMPSTVLIGRDGRVVHRHNGFRTEEAPEIEAVIVAALKERR